MVYLFYTTYISVDLAHQVIFHAKVGKGGIKRKHDTEGYFSTYEGMEFTCTSKFSCLQTDECNSPCHKTTFVDSGYKYK